MFAGSFCILAVIVLPISTSWAVEAAVVYDHLAAAASRPVKIIFDTDMDSDCDDAAALAVLHALADKGEVEILATVVSSMHAWSPAESGRQIGPCFDAKVESSGRFCYSTAADPAVLGRPKRSGLLYRRIYE